MNNQIPLDLTGSGGISCCDIFSKTVRVRQDHPLQIFR